MKLVRILGIMFLFFRANIYKIENYFYGVRKSIKFINIENECKKRLENNCI